jgi:molybdopterin/thiamine biosynthesis adenylyltransferase
MGIEDSGMTTTLVLPESIFGILRDYAKLDVETAAVLLARQVRTPSGDMRFLTTELIPVSDEAYEQRGIDHLRIRSDGYVPALERAEATSTVPIWLHTHPGNGSSPRSSTRDLIVDEQIADLFRLRSGSEFYGALIISRTDNALRFSGHFARESGSTNIDRLLTVGSRLTLTWNDLSQESSLSALFDRNIRAFGGTVQRVLRDLSVAIVGCGGTGSSVAEQLVRLGVRHLLLIDPDTLSESNLTRVYGSRATDIGRAKVEVLADHLRNIAPDVAIKTLKSMITMEATARQLIGADLVFGCTDDNAGRLVLSRLATYMLIPVVDCGVLLTSDAVGRLDGIHGRVTLLYPGTACLVCRDRIDLARAGSEMLTPSERLRRVDEGYAPALPGVEPAVVVYTTLVAASAVGELLERLTCFGPEPVPSEVLLRIHEREISTNEQKPREHHYCHPAVGKIGLGMTEPFLEQTWSA